MSSGSLGKGLRRSGVRRAVAGGLEGRRASLVGSKRLDRSAGRVRGLSGAADRARAAQKRGPGGSGAPSSSIARTVRVDHAEDGDVDPRVGRSASAKRPALWFGIHERSMIEPVVARSGPMGAHERLQVGRIGLGKACAREVGSVRSSKAPGGIGDGTTTQ